MVPLGTFPTTLKTAVKSSPVVVVGERKLLAASER
jgi:hypothetical protein